jgi:hypothetical protein
MGQDPEDLAAGLRNEADLLLERSGLRHALRGYGHVHYSGGYALDLMTRPSLEIQLLLYEMWDPLDAFFALGHQIAKEPGVTAMRFRNHLHQPGRDLPPGLFWDIAMTNPETNADWAIAVWAVDDAFLQNEDAALARLRTALDKASRQRVLSLKHALLEPDGEAPASASRAVCEAVLIEGLHEEAAVREYLRQRGVEGL